MIIEKEGNIFENEHQAYAHVINGNGKMDTGLSLTLKKLYPRMFRYYNNLCKYNLLNSGTGYFYYSKNKLPSVFNLILDSDLYLIAEYYFIKNIIWMHEEAFRRGITDIAMTSQGMGLGSLSKEDLINSLTEYIVDKRIHVTLYLGTG